MPQVTLMKTKHIIERIVVTGDHFIKVLLVIYNIVFFIFFILKISYTFYIDLTSCYHLQSRGIYWPRVD